MKKSKIAIIRTDMAPIDMNTYNCQEVGLAKGLSKLNVDVDIIMFGGTQKIDNTPITLKTNTGKVRIIYIPLVSSVFKATYLYKNIIAGLLSSEHYDLVQANEINEIITTKIARICLRLNIEFIVYQGMYKDLLGKKNYLLQQYLKWFSYPVLRRATKTIAAKTTFSQKYLQSKGFNRTTIFPVGLDTSKFSSPEYFNVREKCNIPLQNKIICYVGVFEKRRNLAFILKLAESLKQHNFSFILVGNGEDFETIKLEATNKKLLNVHFLGKLPQKNIPSLYKTSDAFVLASDYEIYGMVVLESLYFGCPVFSTRTAGPVDMITPYENGYLFDNLNVGDWKSKILNLIDSFDRHLIKERLRTLYLWDELAKTYKEQFLNQ